MDNPQPPNPTFRSPSLLPAETEVQQVVGGARDEGKQNSDNLRISLVFII